MKTTAESKSPQNNQATRVRHLPILDTILGKPRNNPRVSITDITISAIAFLTTLLWTARDGYIFGQDSYSFINPYAYTYSPKIPWNYNAQNTYFYIIESTLSDLIGSPYITQKLLIAALAGIAAIGIMDLLSLLSKIRKANTPPSTLSKTLAVFLYLMNPFSLSVVWPHIEGWTFFMTIAPFILSFFVATHYIGFSLRRATLTTILTIPFAAGLTGPYVILLGYTGAIFMLTEVIAGIQQRELLKQCIGRCTSYLGFLSAIAIWPNIQYVGSTLVPSAPTSAYVHFMLYVESSPTLIQAITQTGYLWIYYVPSAYPWISLLSWLVVASLLLLGTLLTRTDFLLKQRGIKLLSALVLPLVLFMTGSNPPLGIINVTLVSIGGPFEILTAPYVFLGTYYSLYLSIIFSLVFDKEFENVNNALLKPLAIKLKLSNPARQNKVLPKSTTSSNEPSSLDTHRPPTYQTSRPPQSRRRYATSSLAVDLQHSFNSCMVTMALIAVVTIYATPFVNNLVYQPSGPNISEINVPSDYIALSNYLNSNNYTGPFYYVLVLPTSSNTATYLTYGSRNSSFTDSMGLLSEYIPYPTIWNYLPASPILGGLSGAVASPLSGALENITASEPSGNLVAIYTAMHIRYILFNENYNASNRYMLVSPSGTPYNFSTTLQNLNSTLGKPKVIGSLLLYYNSQAQPIAQVTSGVRTVALPSLHAYMKFLSTLSPQANPMYRQLQDAPWLPSTSTIGQEFIPYEYLFRNQSFPIPPNSTPFFVDWQGNIIDNLSESHIQSGQIFVNSTTIASGNLSPTLQGDMRYNLGCYQATTHTTPSPYIATPKRLYGWPKVSFDETLDPSSILPGTAYISSTNIYIGKMATISVTLQHQSKGYFWGMTANMTNNSKYYAWNYSSFMNPQFISNGLHLTLNIHYQSLNLTATSASGSSIYNTIYFGGNFWHTAGNNPSATTSNISKINSLTSGYEMRFSYAANASMCSTLIQNQPPIQYVLFAPKNDSITTFPTTISLTSNGDYSLITNLVTGTRAYVSLFTPITGPWTVQGDATSIGEPIVSNPNHIFYITFDHTSMVEHIIIHLITYTMVATYISYVEIMGTITILALDATYYYWRHLRRNVPRPPNPPISQGITTPTYKSQGWIERFRRKS
jgi:hypothetical protein